MEWVGNFTATTANPNPWYLIADVEPKDGSIKKDTPDADFFT